ncbi:MAG: alpha-L-glutamate ligase-like protein [Myxococcota bacterium]
MFASLERLGLLGINRRNIDFTTRYNPRRLYPLVDNKLRTKLLCIQAGIPTPKVLAKAEGHFGVHELMQRVDALEDFVVKPAKGAMGNGIVVILGRTPQGKFRRTGGRLMTRDDIQYHASGIISGLYALGGQADMVIVEERLIVHPELQQVVFDGVPDIRIIVYRGYPIMAMARLPTSHSGGRANLHQGAIGVGIDISTGTMQTAIMRNQLATIHPDTGARLQGREIPSFRRVLEIAVAAAEKTELGYLGADVVVDARYGPVILELNARPGLSIQLCNRAGLLPRVESINEIVSAERTAFERLELAQAIAKTWNPPQ